MVIHMQYVTTQEQVNNTETHILYYVILKKPLKDCYVESVRKAMVWVYFPTSARSSRTLYHSSGSFLYTVSQLY